MKFLKDEAIWAGNHRHEQIGRDFIKTHWLTKAHVRFIKHRNEDLIEIIANKELELRMPWE